MSDLTPEQERVLSWFFSGDDEAMTVADVREAFAAVGWHNAEDVKAAIFPAATNRCPHIDPDRGQCWYEDAPHAHHIYTGDEFGTAAK